MQGKPGGPLRLGKGLWSSRVPFTSCTRHRDSAPSLPGMGHLLLCEGTCSITTTVVVVVVANSYLLFSGRSWAKYFP